MIAFSRRRQRPGTGSDLRALLQEAPAMEWPDLGPVLYPLRWAVIGAVATRRYMPERVTRDLDVMVAAADVAEAERQLLAAGWERTGELAVAGSAWRSPDGMELDLLACAEPWCERALTEAQGNRDPHGLPVIPLPYLVLLKLRSARLQDTADVSRMLGLADETMLRDVRQVVAEYAPEDVEDLEALIELGKLETEGE